MKTFAATAHSDHRPLPDDTGARALPVTCALSHVKAGTAVRIKRLAAPVHVIQRLREIGLGEQQVIKLLVRQTSLICLVCNARVALSSQLAQMIVVEPLAV